MNLRSFLLPGRFALVLLAASAEARPAEAAEPAFVSIFNGRDFTGWVVPDNNLNWRVEAGLLVGQSEETLSGSILWTEKAHGDFVLELEGRFQGDEIDTGVRIRLTPSLEMQIGVSRSLKVDMTGSILTDGLGHPTRYPEAGRAKDWRSHYRPGEWNTFRIAARGSTFTVWINGVQVSQYTDRRHAEPSRIGLQFHDALKMRLEFRNIRLAEQ
jgi:hypothetical protein